LSAAPHSVVPVYCDRFKSALFSPFSVKVLEISSYFLTMDAPHHTTPHTTHRTTPHHTTLPPLPPAAYQIKNDVWESHHLLINQGKKAAVDLQVLERRIADLEARSTAARTENN